MYWVLHPLRPQDLPLGNLLVVGNEIPNTSWLSVVYVYNTSLLYAVYWRQYTYTMSYTMQCTVGQWKQQAHGGVQVLREPCVALNAKCGPPTTIPTKIGRHHCYTNFCQRYKQCLHFFCHQNKKAELHDIPLDCHDDRQVFDIISTLIKDMVGGVILSIYDWYSQEFVVCPLLTILLDLKMWAWLPIGFCIVRLPQKQISAQRHLINSSASHNWRQILILIQDWDIPNQRRNVIYLIEKKKSQFVFRCKVRLFVLPPWSE